VFLALQRLRSKKGQQRILWIDSISINQKDEAEKTVQVSNMGQIFARAKRVNIWLSRATSAMEGAFEYLRLADGPEIQMPRIPDGMVFYNLVVCWWKFLLTLQLL
jgi:hypothetical protein